MAEVKPGRVSGARGLTPPPYFTPSVQPPAPGAAEGLVGGNFGDDAQIVPGVFRFRSAVFTFIR